MSYNLLNTKEEICLISLLRCAADGESNVERMRQTMCESSLLEPYQMFKTLQSDSLKCLLSVDDLSQWMREQPYKTTLLSDQELAQALQPYVADDKEEVALRYEGFLKLILPRDNPMLRSLVMTRHERGVSHLAREVGYSFVRLIEKDGELHSELMMRKCRLMDSSANSPLKQDIIYRAFRWIQSESSVVGMTHISPLSLRRLLHDTVGALTIEQVESLFRRINVSGSGMVSFAEWESFLSTSQVDQFLSEVFLSQFTTKCPGCGVHTQRDGGACATVKCAYCRASFSCVTNADGSIFENENSYLRPAIREAWGGASAGDEYRSPSPYRSPKAEATMPLYGASSRMSSPVMALSPSSGSRPQSPYMRAKTSRVGNRASAQYQGVRGTSMSSSRGVDAVSPVSPSRFSHASTAASIRDVAYSPKASAYKGGVADMFESRQSRSETLPLVLDVMSMQIDIDNAINDEKKALQRMDLTPEAAFALLDRYRKGYVADTDIWQLLSDEGSPGAVSFSGVCSLLREQKPKTAGSKNVGKLSLAELVHLLCPVESEEVKHVSRDMSDDDTRSVLYTLRNTVACTGCTVRVQRSVEGCPSVTCPVCNTTFRCTKIENTARVSLHEWHEEKRYQVTKFVRFTLQKALKHIVERCEDSERLRKSLLLASGSECVSTIIMDAFLDMSSDKGFFDIRDVKAKMSEHNIYRSEKELDTLGRRYSDGQRISFPDFADQLRPYSTAVAAF